jgi:2-dehydro-3-deoxyphosphogluconate aldolase/(4S)-4-hydroxy-2-oxoglutarate aldolase
MKLLDELRRHRILAIVRGTDPRPVLDTVLTLADAGIALIEVSLTTPGALDIIAAARTELGASYGLGAGTVCTPAEAQAAIDAGAAYLVSPAVVPAVGTCGQPVLMGAVTPTEILTAYTSGAAAVKLFPASIGGPRYVRAVREPLPHIPLVPVGAVDETAARNYLAAGATAVGVGGPLVGDAVAGGDLAALRHRAAVFLDAVSQP